VTQPEDGFPVSVVVPTMRGWPVMSIAISSVLPQVRRVGGQLIIADGSERGLPPMLRDADDVVWLRMPGATVFEIRQAAYRRAEADIIARLGEALVVPRSAVLRDGRRSIVYVESASGEYEQRAVKTGRVGDEGIEILEGLKDGERVVAQGNLMIDAEAQLRSSAAPAQPVSALRAPVGEEFLKQLARVSEGLAADDAVAAVKAGQSLQELAAAIPQTGEAQVDQVLARLKAIPKNPAGSDLKALRQTFLPWSLAGADLALALERGRQDPKVKVFECPMTGDSFPGVRGEPGKLSASLCRQPLPVARFPALGDRFPWPSEPTS
jgi:hypothetical protein